MPDNLILDKENSRVPDSTAIITHHDLNSYITGLELKGDYSPQQNSVIYELLHSNNPTHAQFRRLSTFITTNDFKIIISKLPNDSSVISTTSH